MIYKEKIKINVDRGHSDRKIKKYDKNDGLYS